MPVLQCYVDDQTLAQLQHVSKQLGRSVADLAESAIAEEACQSIRQFGKAEETPNVWTQRTQDAPAA